jgi:hypothetical protein
MAGVKRVLDQLVASGVVREGELTGCSPEEVDELRLDQGVSRLPEEYTCFLRLAGRGAGALMRGTDAFYPGLLGIRQDVESLLEDSGAEVALSADSFVIAMHQGYQAYWIPSVSAGRPEVVIFQEGDGDVRQRWSGVAAYLDDMAAAISG